MNSWTFDTQAFIHWACLAWFMISFDVSLMGEMEKAFHISVKIKNIFNTISVY